MAKRTIRSVKKACDKLWSQIVRQRYPRCVKCGKVNTKYGKEYVEAHHIFSKRCLSTRYEIDNGIGLCSFCHTFDKYGFRQDQHSEENMDIICRCIGKKRYQELEELHYKLKKFTLEELLEIEQKLKNEAKRKTEFSLKKKYGYCENENFEYKSDAERTSDFSVGIDLSCIYYEQTKQKE